MNSQMKNCAARSLVGGFAGFHALFLRNSNVHAPHPPHSTSMCLPPRKLPEPHCFCFYLGFH